MALVLAVVLWTAPTLGETCLTRPSITQLESQLSAAEQAYVALDVVVFTHSLDEAALLLPCIADVLTPATSAYFHRMEGLRLFGAGDEEAAIDALSAARVLDPRYRFPETVLPSTHALRVRYDALQMADTETWRPPRPLQGSLIFDGVHSTVRPTARATLFQNLDATGAPTATTYLYPGQPTPRYAAVRRTRNAFLVGALGAAVVSGAFYAAAWSSRSAFDDTDAAGMTLERLEGLQTETEVFSGLAVSFLVVGASGATAAFLVPEPWDPALRR